MPRVSLQTVLRIWDCLFNEGSKIIFRVALTLIKQHQAFILEGTSMVDICERFKAITRGSFVTECHTFMQASVWAGSAPRPGSLGESPSAQPWPLWASASVGPSDLVDPRPPGDPRQWLPLLLGCKPHDGLQGGWDPRWAGPGSLGSEHSAF